MPKHKEKSAEENHLIYLAEFIGEDDSWEWWNVYDSDKWTIHDVFRAFIEDFQGEAEPNLHENIKRSGQIWEHNRHREFRVWEVMI